MRMWAGWLSGGLVGCLDGWTDGRTEEGREEGKQGRGGGREGGGQRASRWCHSSPQIRQRLEAMGQVEASGVGNEPSLSADSPPNSQQEGPEVMPLIASVENDKPFNATLPHSSGSMTIPLLVLALPQFLTLVAMQIPCPNRSPQPESLPLNPPQLSRHLQSSQP